jgi:copper chaperone CopZ
VEKVSISFKAKRAEVFFDPNKANETEMVNRVNQIGFKAKVVE